MKVFLLANTVFLLATVGYGWLAGDRRDREAVGWIVAAITGTVVTRLFAPAGTQDLVVLVIDVALLVAVISVSMRSERFWPIWFAAFHLVAVVSTILIINGVAPPVLVRISGFWDTAALLAMVLGLYLDRKRAGVAD